MPIGMLVQSLPRMEMFSLELNHDFDLLSLQIEFICLHLLEMERERKRERLSINANDDIWMENIPL